MNKIVVCSLVGLGILFLALLYVQFTLPWVDNKIVTDEGLSTSCHYVKVKGKDYLRCYTAYGYYVIYPDREEKE